MVASANFTVNSSAVPPEVAVAASSLVTLELLSASGADTIAWSIIGNHAEAAVNPTITPAGTPLGKTATFTMPAGDSQAYLVQCQINGGVDSEGVEQATYTKTAIVGVVNTRGVVPFAFGENFERSATHGTTEALNALAEGGAGLGDVVGPAGATAGNLPQYSGGTGKSLSDSGIAAAAVELAYRSQSSYTAASNDAVLLDARKCIITTRATAISLRIRLQASIVWLADTLLGGINTGAGTLTITAEGGVTLNGSVSVPQHGWWWAKRTASNTWQVFTGGTGGGGTGDLKADGTVAMTADFDFGGNQASDAGDAIAATDLTTLQQVQILANRRPIQAYTGASNDLTETDSGKFITSSHGSALSLRIRLQSAVTWLSETELVGANIGAGTLTITAEGGVTLNGSVTVAANGWWFAKRTASNTWQVFVGGAGSSVTAGNGLTDTAGTFSVDADGGTLTVASAGVKVSSSGITATELASNAVTTVKILDANVTDAKLASAFLKADHLRVDVVATTNVASLSGLAVTIDSVLCNVANKRLLLTGQTTQSQNGPWLAQSGAWTRPTDYAAGGDASGRFFFVDRGAVYANTGWLCVEDSGSAVIDTNNVLWAQFSGAGAIGTAQLADGAVTYPKIQDVSAASRVLLRGSAAGAGDVQEGTCGVGIRVNGTAIELSALLAALATAGGALAQPRMNVANSAVEWFLAPSPVDGGNLTNANVTKAISDGSQFTLPTNTLSASNKTLTLGTSGAPEDEETIEVIVYAQTTFDFILKDGGAIGNNLFTVAAGTKRVLHAQWSAAAAAWRAAGKIRFT